MNFLNGKIFNRIGIAFSIIVFVFLFLLSLIYNNYVVTPKPYIYDIVFVILVLVHLFILYFTQSIITSIIAGIMMPMLLFFLLVNQWWGFAIAIIGYFVIAFFVKSKALKYCIIIELTLIATGIGFFTFFTDPAFLMQNHIIETHYTPDNKYVIQMEESRNTLISYYHVKYRQNNKYDCFIFDLTPKEIYISTHLNDPLVIEEVSNDFIKISGSYYDFDVK